MTGQAAYIANGLLDLLYPPLCLLCEARLESGAMCADCQRQITPLLPPFCDRCGVSIRPDCIICEPCENGNEPPFHWAQALGTYDGPLLEAIHLLKYNGKAALAEPLGLLLARSLDAPTQLIKLREGRPAFDAVVPIPLHPARQRERGFNQAERIAQVVAREWNWKLDSSGLRRVRRTRPQARMNSAEERAANIRDAFAARSPLHFENQHVLLIDDVITTTSTLRAAANAVRDAGATRICVLALARGG